MAHSTMADMAKVLRLLSQGEQQMDVPGPYYQCSPEAILEAEELGWIERKEGVVRLTDDGATALDEYDLVRQRGGAR